MIEEYKTHNLFFWDEEDFIKHDPQLSRLAGLPFIHPMNWWVGINWDVPGIYLLTGGRQIGKTTSAKLLLKDSLKTNRFKRGNMFYLPCDQIEDHIHLGKILRAFLSTISKIERYLLIIDEVTYVSGWDRAIKALADEGAFRSGFCIVTGSDSIIIKDAISRFPGRRGEATKTDFHLAPLDFAEYVGLVQPEIIGYKAATQSQQVLDLFQNYMKCGGHLRAINDLHGQGQILPATYSVYEQWICGDFQKKGKSIRHLKAILKALIETSGSQVSYSSLVARVGEMSKPTFIDYCDMLERLDVLFNLQAFDQNSRIGFPKKARKFYFWDPFIFDTVQKWLVREGDISPAHDQDPVKAEAIAVVHFKRRCPTFYFKGHGEIDIVACDQKEPLYAEVKWTRQIRGWDISELKKRKRSMILTQAFPDEKIEGIEACSLPIFLIKDYSQLPQR